MYMATEPSLLIQRSSVLRVHVRMCKFLLFRLSGLSIISDHSYDHKEFCSSPIK